MAAARRRRGEPPAYLHHRGSGQAYCTIGGKPIYLGLYGSHASRRAYNRVLKEWEREQPGEPIVIQSGCLIRDLIDAFIADRKRRLPTIQQFTNAFRILFEDGYANRLCDDFKGKDLRAIRERWVRMGLAQTTIKNYTGSIRQLFRWGVDPGECVEPAILVSLEAVRGEGEGRETEPVPAVTWEQVEATLPHMPAVLGAMVRANWFIGCRPGELCRMKTKEINRQGQARLPRGRTVQLPGGLWVFQPTQFKQRRKKKYLSYLLGPRAQAILVPYLRDDLEAYLFSPKEARPGRKRPPPHFATEHYSYAIIAACQAAGIESWTSNQLRHAALTRYDAAAGIEATSRIVGHSSVAVTETYIEADLRRAAEIVEKLG